MKTSSFLFALVWIAPAFAQERDPAKTERVQWAAQKMANQYCQCSALSVMLDIRVDEHKGKLSQEEAGQKIVPFIGQIEQCLAPFEQYNEGLSETQQVEAANTMRLIIRNQCPAIAEKFEIIEGKR